MATIDIKIDDPFNTGGDLNLQNSDYQNVQAIIYTQKGQFYQWPLLGVGIIDYINSPDDLVYLRSVITAELKKDKYELTEYEAFINNSILQIFIDSVRNE